MKNNLNPNYRFDSFVVGSFNELAHAAAQSIVKNPGNSYNPLFIYGEAGTGKTHLLYATGNAIKRIHKNKKILYVTVEKLVEDLLAPLRITGEAVDFREKYKKYDVLMVDDLHYLSGKEKTQEEITRLLDCLYDNGKQVILASGRPLKCIPKIEEHAKSRYEGGMIADIAIPNEECRVAILKTKARIKNFSLPSKVFEHLAILIEKDIRKLVGALNWIICHSKLKRKRKN